VVSRSVGGAVREVGLPKFEFLMHDLKNKFSFTENCNCEQHVQHSEDNNNVLFVRSVSKIVVYRDLKLSMSHMPPSLPPVSTLTKAGNVKGQRIYNEICR
jgi:hypothetical protein